MAALSLFNLGSNTAFTEIPLRNYTATDATNGVTITDKNLVMILGIVVLDATVDSAAAAGLNPAKTTYTPSSGGGGGNMGWLSLLMLIGIAAMSRSRR
jgi:peptidyl-prolyl cis-trans isomerase A (cyclophilin A)